MAKKILLSILLSVLFINLTSLVHAQNNKYGISLLQPSSEDIEEAARLVNGSEGSWGYVTLVIQEDDKNVHKWQDIFEHLRFKKLIPIIRIATRPEGDVWRRPQPEDAKSWIEFLEKLNWVAQNRYVVLFNEPNHASEWGGEVDPRHYYDVSYTFAKTFKEKNKDYVVMLAGLDGAAPQYGTQYFDNLQFIRDMCEKGCKELFHYIDAWSTHAYPNPGFSGSVWDSGKRSIRGYNEELSTVVSLGITKELPIFITETGWNTEKVSNSQAAFNMKTAYTEIWLPDSRIQAVTPFVFKYLSPPFLGFSWKTEQGNTEQFVAVSELPKTKGKPKQYERGVLDFKLPSKLLVESTYHLTFQIKNTGQAIWDSQDGYVYALEHTGEERISALLPEIHQIRPYEEERVDLYIKTSSSPENFSVRLLLMKEGDIILASEPQRGLLEPLPSLEITTSLFPKFISDGNDFELQLFNNQEELVYRKRGLTMRKGKLVIDTITNVIPGDSYRVVLVGYPYIPRQEIFSLHKGANTVRLKRMFPFDADGDGAWTIKDVGEVLKHPSFLIRFVPWNQL